MYHEGEINTDEGLLMVLVIGSIGTFIIGYIFQLFSYLDLIFGKNVLIFKESVSNKNASGSIFINRAEEMMNREILKLDMGGLC